MALEGRVRTRSARAEVAASRTPNRRRRAVLLAAAALALGAALVFLFPRRKAAPPVAGPPATSAAPSVAALVGAGPTSIDEPAPAQEQQSPVESVKVEKPVVCEGEENLITVRLRDGAGDHAQRVLVGSVPGVRVPLRRWLSASGSVEPAEVVAFGASGATYMAAVPPYEVRRCKDEPQWLVEARPLPNAIDTFELRVRSVAPPGGEQDKTLRSVRWDYGDGQQDRGASLTTTHSFARREQSNAYSYMLVEAEIEQADGRRARARTSLELVNLAAQSRRR
ncbi:MAG: hypothetical protein K0S65_6061, partial [Labilithrix sp.]|nr:hypothetical protein [Labilithrix sp.]